MTHQSSFAVIYWLRSFPPLPRPHLSLTSILLSHTSHTHVPANSPCTWHLVEVQTKKGLSNQQNLGKSTKPGRQNAASSLNCCSSLTTGQTTVYLLLKTLWYDQKIQIELMDLFFFCQWLFPRSNIDCPLTPCNCLLTLTPTLTLGHNPYRFWPRSHRGSSPGASRTPFGKACWAKKRGAPVERGCMGNCMIKSK